MSESEWTKILGWPGYRVYRSEVEVNEEGKTLRLCVRRKRGNRKPECCGCGRRVNEIAETYECEVRDLPWSEYRTTVVIELYRVRCPDCGIKAAKVTLLPSKAPFSKRFEEAAGRACESAAQAQASQDQQAVMRSRGDVTDLKTTTNNTVMALRESLKEVKNVRHYHYPGWLRGSRLCAALARTGSRSTDPLQFADHARGFAEQPVGVLRLRPPVAGFGLFRRPFERCGGFRLHLG
jgi:hypothetical protein